jgi:hypothetical protein
MSKGGKAIRFSFAEKPQHTGVIVSYKKETLY